MKQLKGFVKPRNEYLACQVNKTLYGLHKAPSTWYEKTNKFFRSVQMTKCGVDSNLYF